MIQHQEIEDNGQFLILNPQRIQGQCIHFSHRDELIGRDPSVFQIKTQEHPNWQPITEYIRNKIYSNQNVRTPEVLKKCLHFLIEQFLIPKVPQVLKAELKNERDKLLYFIYQRVKAIRQEYYVQKVFAPREGVIIFKIILILQVLMNFEIKPTGIQNFLLEDLRTTFLNHYKSSYLQALKYTIMLTKTHHLLELLNNHPIATEEKQLAQMLNLRKKIQSGNYYQYLVELSKNDDIIVRFILWLRIQQFRVQIQEKVKSSRMKVEKEWLCKIMSFPKQEGWIQLHKEGIESLNPEKLIVDLPVTSWISKKSILKYFKTMI